MHEGGVFTLIFGHGLIGINGCIVTLEIKKISVIEYECFRFSLGMWYWYHPLVPTLEN